MTIFGFILGAVLLIWVLFPLFKKLGFWVPLDESIRDLEDHKQRVYRNITDLEFDFAMGRLSEGDFNRIRNEFAREAGQVLEKIEGSRDGRITDMIERDLKKLGTSPAEHHQVQADKKFCTACGSENAAQAKFCISCGEAFA